MYKSHPIINAKKIVLLILLLLPITGWSAAPCSGKKAGISHCDGPQFVCNDGSVSKSTKDCSSYLDKKQQTNPVPVQEYSGSRSVAEANTEITWSGNILKLDYPGFTVWLDCTRRGAIKFQYVAQRDNGNAKRYDKFFLDPNVPAGCQQKTAKPYGQGYDRGHQVSSNHLDASEETIKATNTMTNIIPQAANMNRGAWLQTEEITECYRIAELLVIGGVIWGDNPADDYFVESHGIKTPDAFWKVIIRGTGQDERVIAWVVPNTQDATRKRLDHYLVSVDEIERITGEKIPVADYAKHDKPSQSWMIPMGCDKG